MSGGRPSPRRAQPDSQRSAGRASLAASDAYGSQASGSAQGGLGRHASPSGGEAFMPTEEQLPGQPQRALKGPPAKCVYN